MHCNIPSVSLPTRSSSIGLFQIPSSRKISTDDNFFIRSTRAANELIWLKIISFDMSLTTLKHSLSKYLLARTYDFYNLNNSCSHFVKCFHFVVHKSYICVHFNPLLMELSLSLSLSLAFFLSFSLSFSLSLSLSLSFSLSFSLSLHEIYPISKVCCFLCCFKLKKCLSDRFLFRF